MSTFPTSCGRASDDLSSIVALLVLGAGFIALFAGFNYFFLIWILGFTVLVPIIDILSDENEDDDEWSENDTATQHKAEHEDTATDPQASTATGNALSILRERYARGDLTDEQFEAKLDRLLETETPEHAAEWRKRMARDAETESS